jgi:uncharacterized protein (DUF983 family)
MLKGSKLYSVLTNTCPKCQKGRFFKNPNPYHLRQFDKMNKRCSHCNESFEREPGFYIGSMYISYALSVSMTAIIFVTCIVIMNLDIYLVIGLLSASFIALLPVIFRLSRLIWINIFVNFDPARAKKGG